jgi:PKD repeat protein
VKSASEPPTAVITATPSSGNAPLAVAFNASGSRDPNSGGSIKQYSFNFGDGSALATQKTPTVKHTYTSAASHIASVTVTDKEGETSTATVTVKTTQ